MKPLKMGMQWVEISLVKSQLIRKVPMFFRHILIVGGTGMLRGVTSHFIEKGHIVSVLARNEKRLKSLKKDYPKKRDESGPFPRIIVIRNKPCRR